uniref:Uncharacterized protein n=1 Tax=Oryza brachyantha TaxID=4533 RepID=J3MQA9_ORYBR
MENPTVYKYRDLSRKEGTSCRKYTSHHAKTFRASSRSNLMHVFSKLPRDLNFIDHTSDNGRKAYLLLTEEQWLSIILDSSLADKQNGSSLCCVFVRLARAMPMIVDPGFPMKTKGELFWIPERRRSLDARPNGLAGLGAGRPHDPAAPADRVW